MKHARVMVQGMVYNATERDGQVVLEDGRRLWQDQVTWLPPLAPLAQIAFPCPAALNLFPPSVHASRCAG